MKPSNVRKLGMQAAEVHKIGQHKGAPRVWLEGAQPARAGFAPGTRFTVEVVRERNMVALKVAETGIRVVSKKTRAGQDIPVIDINSKEVLGLFKGLESIRVLVSDQVIYLLPLATEVRKQERLARLKAKLSAGEPILTGSLSHGGGVLTHAIHKGLGQAGVQSKLAFACDIDLDVLAQAQAHNDAWDDDTISVGLPLQELAFDEFAIGKLPKVDVLEAGIPCSAHSVAARAKKQTKHPEDDPAVGHLVVGFLSIVAKINPAVVTIENVGPYQGSASMSIIRNQLADMGYQVHERILNAADWNCLEARVRLCVVAVTEGVDFDFDALEVPDKVSRRLGDILEDVAPDAPNWGRYDYLKTKEERDALRGNSFSMQTFSDQDDHVSTLRKYYHKGGSTDPLLKHPTDPDLLRQFTAVEHARAKDIPEHLITGMSKTAAHELLGQSIAYPPFVAVGKLIGRTLKSLAMPAAQAPELLAA